MSKLTQQKRYLDLFFQESVKDNQVSKSISMVRETADRFLPDLVKLLPTEEDPRFFWSNSGKRELEFQNLKFILQVSDLLEERECCLVIDYKGKLDKYLCIVVYVDKLEIKDILLRVNGKNKVRIKGNNL